jgi:hypothetical protein
MGSRQWSRARERVIAESISGLIGCNPADISVHEFHSGRAVNTWTAECYGQTFRCTASAVDIACAPAARLFSSSAHQSTERAAVERARAGPRRNAAVRRVRSAQGSDWLLVASWRSGIYHLELVARPALYRDAVQMTVSVPVSFSEYCGVDTIADGSIVRHDVTVERAAGRLGFRTIVDIERVRAYADAASAAGRVCDGEWRFDDEAQRILHDLLRRFADEVAFTRSRQL